MSPISSNIWQSRPQRPNAINARLDPSACKPSNKSFQVIERRPYGRVEIHRRARKSQQNDGHAADDHARRTAVEGFHERPDRGQNRRRGARHDSIARHNFAHRSRTLRTSSSRRRSRPSTPPPDRLAHSMRLKPKASDRPGSTGSRRAKARSASRAASKPWIQASTCAFSIRVLPVAPSARPHGSASAARAPADPPGPRRP